MKFVKINNVLLSNSVLLTDSYMATIPFKFTEIDFGSSLQISVSGSMNLSAPYAAEVSTTLGFEVCAKLKSDTSIEKCSNLDLTYYNCENSLGFSA